MKITCEVIQDLLPLFVDNILSGDSCHLVEEHLETCDACQKVWKELRKEQHYIEDPDSKNEIEREAKAAFRGVRRSILIKRVLAVCLSIVCVLATVRAGYYFYAEKQTYIPFEESGLVMEGDRLYASKTYYGRLTAIISPDQKVQFWRMMETAEIKKRYPSRQENMLIVDYGEQLEQGQGTQGSENRMSGIERVYYLPKAYANFQFDYDNPELGAQQTLELESKSVLLWDRAENGNQKTNAEIEAENLVGEGFIPPKGSRRDKNGNIVDQMGNTFNEKGEWQIPEGGSVDAKGRILDRNGNIMGGGAVVGASG